jgi:hypothetical protein
MSRETVAAYSEIQRVVKATSGYGGSMHRDFVHAEQRAVEDALVVLEIFTEERGYRKGFEAAARQIAERERTCSALLRLRAIVTLLREFDMGMTLGDITATLSVSDQRDISAVLRQDDIVTTASSAESKSS